MALSTCPECGGQVSDAATACPHCGYPVAAAPSGGIEQQLERQLGPSVARQVEAALRSAGFDHLASASVRIEPPVVSYTTTTTASPPVPAVPSWTGYGYDYKSRWTFLGLPLLAMTRGYDPATGRKRVAKGWVAIGDVAVGGLAIGGAAFGGVCLGGLAVGVVSLGGLAVGLALAVGGGAIGTVAFGGAAAGLWAAGGGAVGWHVFGPASH